MKIYLPRGSRRTDDEQKAWLETLSKHSAAFHQKYAPKFPNITMDMSRVAKLKAGPGLSKYATPMWQEHLDQLMAVSLANPEVCLRDPLLQYAFNLSVGGVFARQEIPYLEERYDRDELKKLLKEGAFPGQVIIDPQYESSEARIHHLTHLTTAARAFRYDLSSISTIIEFGGGYGGMAHMMRTISPNCTHIVIDLPEMLVFQSFTLGRVLGPDAYNFVTPDAPQIKKGAINFVSIEQVEGLAGGIPAPDLFVATWSLSEANAVTNKLIQKDLKFFNAQRILYGYRRYHEPNPRQPESKELDLPAGYENAFHGPSFFAIENEHYYQFAQRA